MPNRLDSIANSASILAKEKADALKAKGIDIIDLGVGEPDFPTPDAVKAAAKAALDTDRTHYTSSRGILELREAIACFQKEKNGGGCAPEKILVTPGAKQGIYYLMAALLDHGDEVIIPEPAWLSYGDIVKLNYGIPVPVPSSMENGFLPSLEEIKKAITKRTKVILINNPVNPTGAVYPKEFLKGLVELCEESGVFLVSDEIYSDIVFGEEFVSALSFGSRQVAIVNGFSKMAAMTGWRLGYVIAETAIINRCVKLQQQTATCPSSVSQYAAIAACKEFDSYFPAMLKSYEKRRKLLVDGIRSIGKLKCFEPKGAFYVFVDLRKTGLTSQEAVETLLEKAHISSVSGAEYGKCGEGFVRLSFAVSETRLAEAVERIREVFG